MYVFSLDVRKMIKESVVHMLYDKMRKTPAIKKTNDKEEQFRSIKSTDVRMTNKFLRDAEQQYPGYGLKLNYSRSDCQIAIFGFYTEIAIQGMLKVSDHDSPDNGLLFLGALVDAFCGISKSAKVVKTFTRYVDMVNCMFRRGQEMFWNEESLALHHYQIVNLDQYLGKTFQHFSRTVR